LDLIEEHGPMPIAKIAEAMGITEDAVKSIEKRALAKLRSNNLLKVLYER
jgi:DNA-directed RNA polymerase specialized sigma24 family protein